MQEGELDRSVQELKKLMRSTRIQVYWYLAILTLSTVSTVAYQMTVVYQTRKTAKELQLQIREISELAKSTIRGTDSKVDSLLDRGRRRPEMP